MNVWALDCNRRRVCIGRVTKLAGGRGWRAYSYCSGEAWETWDRANARMLVNRAAPERYVTR